MPPNFPPPDTSLSPVGHAIGEAVARNLVPFLTQEREIGQIGAKLDGAQKDIGSLETRVEKYDGEAKQRDRDSRAKIEVINEETFPAVWDEIGQKASTSRLETLEKKVEAMSLFQARIAILGTVLMIVVPILANLIIAWLFKR